MDHNEAMGIVFALVLEGLLFAMLIFSACLWTLALSNNLPLLAVPAWALWRVILWSKRV